MMARAALLAGLVLGAVPQALAEPVAVDLELAFVVDASGSIDAEETRLQRQGYADALANERVIGVISRGILRSIAVSYIEFAADGCTQLSVPWARIDGAEAAIAFGQQILAQPRLFCPGGNAIGEALTFAAASIQSNQFEGTRRVIDISGDGPNTIGIPVVVVRDLVVASAITINGLVIERPSMPELDIYYREVVTGGPLSFVLKAENRQVFARAILKKLIIEIAGAVGPPLAGETKTAERQ